MAMKHWKLRNKKEIRKCYKCDKIEHLAKDCRIQQKMKNRSIQDSDKESDNKQKGFVRGSE